MADEFFSVPDTQTGQAQNLTSLVPSDAADIAFVSKAIYVGIGGNLAVIAEDDTVAVTLANVQSGTILPIRVRRVMATNTTASSIVNLY